MEQLYNRLGKRFDLLKEIKLSLFLILLLNLLFRKGRMISVQQDIFRFLLFQLIFLQLLQLALFYHLLLKFHML